MYTIRGIAIPLDHPTYMAATAQPVDGRLLSKTCVYRPSTVMMFLGPNLHLQRYRVRVAPVDGTATCPHTRGHGQPYIRSRPVGVRIPTIPYRVVVAEGIPSSVLVSDLAHRMTTLVQLLIEGRPRELRGITIESLLIWVGTVKGRLSVFLGCPVGTHRLQTNIFAAPRGLNSRSLHHQLCLSLHTTLIIVSVNPTVRHGPRARVACPIPLCSMCRPTVYTRTTHPTLLRVQRIIQLTIMVNLRNPPASMIVLNFG